MPYPEVAIPETLPKDRFLKWLRDKKGVKSLHHANTVTTALSFLKVGGLVSRARAEHDGLPQTKQYTDKADKAYGIFDKIFLDPADLHQTLRRRNQYGPVTFVFDVDVIALACVSEVRVTRLNPSGWNSSSVSSKRCWLNTPEEVKDEFNPAGFKNHVVLTCEEELLPFAGYLRRVILDDPEAKLPSKSDAYETASAALAAELKKVGLGVEKRVCPAGGCKCKKEYRYNLAPGFLIPE